MTVAGQVVKSCRPFLGAFHAVGAQDVEQVPEAERVGADAILQPNSVEKTTDNMIFLILGLSDLTKFLCYHITFHGFLK